jgi:hypothetical protein
MDCDCAFDTTGHASCGVSTSKTCEQLDERFRHPLLAYCDGWAGETTRPLVAITAFVVGDSSRDSKENVLPQFSDHEACILTTNMKGENIC